MVLIAGTLVCVVPLSILHMFETLPSGSAIFRVLEILLFAACICSAVMAGSGLRHLLQKSR